MNEQTNVVDMEEWLARKIGFESAAALEEQIYNEIELSWLAAVAAARQERKLERARAPSMTNPGRPAPGEAK